MPARRLTLLPVSLWMMLMMVLIGNRQKGAAQSPLDLSAIDRFITEQLAAQRIPGVALALTQGDQVLYVQGYGTAGAAQSVTGQTQFFVASLSKSFTALAVMQLVEAGHLYLAGHLWRIRRRQWRRPYYPIGEEIDLVRRLTRRLI